MSDLTLPSGRNLMARVRDLVLRRVPSGRIRVVLNGAKDTSAANAAKMLDSISTGFQAAGIIDNDDRIANGMALGSFPHDTPSLARVLDGVLYAATGHSEFDPEQHPDRYVVAGRNGGLFGWLRQATGSPERRNRDGPALSMTTSGRLPRRRASADAWR